MALTVVERIDKWGKLYVRNMTRDPEAHVMVHFRVPGRQKPHVLTIPPGPYPYQIYPGRLPESAIRESPEELMRFIEQGVLKVVPGKKARAILRDPEVKAEVKAMFSRANSERETRRWAREQKAQADALGNAGGGADAVTGAPPADEYVSGPRSGPRGMPQPMNPLQQILANQGMASSAPSRSAHQLAVAGAPDNVNPRVLGLMASYMPQRDSETLKKLQAMRSSLSLADLNFVLQRGGGGKTAVWAQRQIERITRGRDTAAQAQV